jgi:ankyrin repeat protein
VGAHRCKEAKRARTQRCAITAGDLAGAKTARAEGASLTAVLTEGGSNALQLSAHSNKLELVRWILTEGAVIDAQRSDGLTALHLAAHGGHAAAADLLLRAGADATVYTHRGRTALVIARHQNHGQVVQLLESVVAEPEPELVPEPEPEYRVS